MSNKSHKSFVVVVFYPFDVTTSRPQSEIRDFMQKGSVPRNSHSLLVVSAGRLKDDDGHTLTPKERLLHDANSIPPRPGKKLVLSCSGGGGSRVVAAAVVMTFLPFIGICT